MLIKKKFWPPEFSCRVVGSCTEACPGISGTTLKGLSSVCQMRGVFYAWLIQLNVVYAFNNIQCLRRHSVAKIKCLEKISNKPNNSNLSKTNLI